MAHTHFECKACVTVIAIKQHKCVLGVAFRSKPWSKRCSIAAHKVAEAQGAVRLQPSWDPHCGSRTRSALCSSSGLSGCRESKSAACHAERCCHMLRHWCQGQQTTSVTGLSAKCFHILDSDAACHIFICEVT